LIKPYDFRKKVAVNFESQQAVAAKVGSYGITIGIDMMVLTLMTNMDMAEQQEWGREFRMAMQSIRKKYLYHHVHDDALLQDILKELAAADRARVLREAPEPESANAVGEQLTLLQQMMQQVHEYEEEANAVHSDSKLSADTKKSKSRKYPYHHVHDDALLQDILKELAAADRARVLREAPEPESANAVGEQLTLLQQMMQQVHEYEEEANAVHSDSELSADTKKSKSRKTRDRSNSPVGNKRHGRGNSRRGEHERNKCRHCKPYRRYSNARRDEKKCFYNKQWKGWCPGYVCEELEIKFKPKSKFTRAMCGVKDASDDESE
jgi:hypothetical protein